MDQLIVLSVLSGTFAAVAIGLGIAGLAPLVWVLCAVGGVILARLSYLAAVAPVLPRLHALAHVTGGGIPGNLVRVLPAGCEAVVEARGWSWPPLFRVLMRAGEVSLGEMRRVFNLGVGMIAVAARDDAEAVIAAARRSGLDAWVIGEVRAGTRGVKFAER